jgi:hypothetical protein
LVFSLLLWRRRLRGGFTHSSQVLELPLHLVRNLPLSLSSFAYSWIAYFASDIQTSRWWWWWCRLWFCSCWTFVKHLSMS